MMSIEAFHHALAVAGRVDGAAPKLAALLHDAVEDDLCTLEDLRDAEIPEDVVMAIDLLTRRSSETYTDYIQRIRDGGNDLAIYVKLADLDANLCRMDSSHATLTGRYRHAERVLRGVAA